MIDTYYMDMALKQARGAGLAGEIPIGAVLVRSGEVFSAKANLRETANDPAAHAEILALQHAAEMGEGWRLEDSTLYVTVEPCLMCSGAIYLARVKRVVFGCANPKGGALRFVSEHRHTLALNHEVEIANGVREFECAQLLREFFKERRLENKTRRDGRAVEGA